MTPLDAMRAEAPPGCCFCCDRPLPPPKRADRRGRPRSMCGERDCYLLYFQVRKMGLKR